MKRMLATAVLSVLLIIPNTRAETFNIEIDYMGQNNGANHSHQPSAAVIAAVVQMFACQGHTLNVVVDDALTHYNVLRRDPNNCGGSLFNYSGTAASYGAIENANRDNFAGWYYCVFAHNYENTSCNTTGSSGLSNGADNFIVTLGSFSGSTGTERDQANTLAHEFGHNLGQSHCGTGVCPNNDNGDPNWVGPHGPLLMSVMSYRYQLTGVRARGLCLGVIPELALFKELDYSHGRLCGVNEASLNEQLGTFMTRVDWDCDGSIDVANVSQDINGTGSGLCSANGNISTNSDYNEWDNLSPGASLLLRVNTPPRNSVEVALRDTAIQELARRPEIPCISAEEWERVQDEDGLRGSCTEVALSTESCISENRNVYVGNFFFVETGICPFPYDSVIQAHNAAPNNYRMYLRPRTYDEVNNSLLTKPGFLMCESSGSALIK